MMRLPEAVVADEGVCEHDELSHDGGEGDFGSLSLGEQAVIEGLDPG